MHDRTNPTRCPAGHEQAPDARFCGVCGAVIATEPSEPAAPAGSGGASVDTSPSLPAAPNTARRRRVAAGGAALLVSMVVAGLVLISGGTSGDDGDETGKLTQGATVSDEAPETTGAADPDDPAAYHAAGDATPALAPACEGGLFSLCLGTPVDKAAAMFGLEEKRYGDPEALTRRWNVAGFHISVTGDAIGAITGLSASIPDGVPIPDHVLALPDGLILGGSTMADAAQLDPHDQLADMYENTAIYDYVFRFGPEGSNELTLGYSTDYGAAFSDQDPEGFNEALGAKLIRHFHATSATTEGTPPPGPPPVQPDSNDEEVAWAPPVASQPVWEACPAGQPTITVQNAGFVPYGDDGSKIITQLTISVSNPTSAPVVPHVALFSVMYDYANSLSGTSESHDQGDFINARAVAPNSTATYVGEGRNYYFSADNPQIRPGEIGWNWADDGLTDCRADGITF